MPSTLKSRVSDIDEDDDDISNKSETAQLPTYLREKIKLQPADSLLTEDLESEG